MSMPDSNKVGLLLIATGQEYWQYIDPLIESAKKFFVPHEVVLFTDCPRRYDIPVQINIKNLGFPQTTLKRYHLFVEYEQYLAKFDYLFYCDIDMLFINPVGPEILCGGITATLHSGYDPHDSDKVKFFLEGNRRSTAFTGQVSNYVCGGFNGGTTDEFLKMAREIRRNVDIDESKNILAKWHDESHLNCYLWSNPPSKILDHGYCYPEANREVVDHYKKNGEQWGKDVVPRIICLHKPPRPQTHEKKGVNPLPPEKKVSVVIPLFNQADYVGQCIESVLAQTYKDVEVIVVNDGSTDSSLEIIKRYPVHIVNQSNKGLAGARNAGVMNSLGDAILPLDADDWIERTYLEKTVPLLSGDIGFVSTDMQRFGVHNHLLSARVRTLDQQMIDNNIPVCSLISRKAFLETGGYSGRAPGYEDWNLWIDILKRGWKMAVVNEPLFHYRCREYTMTHEAGARHDELYQIIRKCHKDIFK